MIFYFSGTGNSAYAAGKLLHEHENLISMAKANQENTFSYDPAPGEAVGFVFPVYFYGLPDTVRSFVRKVRFTRRPDYLYSVITCGGSIAGAGGLLQQYLNDYRLDAIYSVKMPDNYVLMYDVTTEAQEKPILAAAEEELKRIAGCISEKKPNNTKPSAGAKLQTALLYPFYDRTRTTKKFYTDDKCVSCGARAARCPAKAIELINGTPTWIKERCDHCLSCVRCNAVQYGKRTVGKYRYKHPSLRKKTEGHDDHSANHDCCKTENDCCCTEQK